jgi:hypothetical protein
MASSRSSNAHGNRGVFVDDAQKSRARPLGGVLKRDFQVASAFFTRLTSSFVHRLLLLRYVSASRVACRD